MPSLLTTIASMALFTATLLINTTLAASEEDHVLPWPADMPGWGRVEVDREAFAQFAGPMDAEAYSLFEQIPETQTVERANPDGPDVPCANPYYYPHSEFVRGVYCLPDGVDSEMVDAAAMEMEAEGREAALVRGTLGGDQGASGLGLLTALAAAAPMDEKDCIGCFFMCVVTVFFCSKYIFSLSFFSSSFFFCSSSFRPGEKGGSLPFLVGPLVDRYYHSKRM